MARHGGEVNSMKGLLFPALMGIFLIALGTVTMVGWYAHIPSLITTLPNEISMWFNDALGFTLAGLGLFIPEIIPRYKSIIRLVIGIVLVTLGGVSLSQDLFNYSAGIDQFFVSAWLNQNALHPGRIADANAICFLLAGITFILFAEIEKLAVSIITQLFIFCIAAIGVAAICGYMLNIQFLYGWNLNSQITFYAAIANTLLGFGLWSLWNNDPVFILHRRKQMDKKIILLCGVTIACVFILTGLIVYALFENTAAPSQAHNERTYLIVLLTLVVGLFLLYLEIIPLIRRVIFSEKETVLINKQLQESENRFRSAFDFAAIGMALISLEFHFLKVNPSLCHILGYSEDDILRMDPRSLIEPEDFKRSVNHFQEMLDGKIKSFQLEQRFFHKNKDAIWMLVSTSLIHDALDHPLYFICQIQNINAEKRAEEQLRQMAFHDPLTGLANRNKLEQYVNQLINTATRNQPGFALFLLDLDNFKTINDSIGHDAGDLLLQVVAERLKITVRDTDLVARLGGDEFVIVITNIKKIESVAQIAQKILHNMLKPLVIRGHEIYVTTSIGISFFPTDGQDIQTLMKNADLALYRTKEEGRNNYQFCTPEITKRAHEKMLRQNALNYGLVKDEFFLYYQPILDLKTDRISSVEALLRWRNKEFGSITTEEIIALCEESGLIIALSEWIIRTACKQVKSWQENGYEGLTVSINLSPRQFKQVNFVKSVMQILKDIDFPPHCLELEITESLIMQDPENTLQILQQFKNIGIKIAIDDFGTGYSSMSYLKRFSVDKIKIDNTFMRQIPKDETAISIVTAMIAMSTKLGIKTLAEGIETKDQYEFLIREGASEMQGYYLSRPLPIDLMAEYLARCAKGNILAGSGGAYSQNR